MRAGRFITNRTALLAIVVKALLRLVQSAIAAHELFKLA
jgi:hypothetical protein